MQAPTMGSIEQSLQVLKLIAAIIGLFSLLGPILIAAFLWRLQKTFATKKDLDGLGSRVTAYESFTIATRERVDNAHERMDKQEASLNVKLEWIRRDLDELISQKNRRAANDNS